MIWPELPQNWSEWNIVEKLGEGAYGAVYKAEREIENEKISCAIKIINPAGDEAETSELYRVLGSEESVGAYYQDWIRGFTQEIQTMEKLKGITNIVSIQDYEIVKTDKMNWLIYIRMELLQSFTHYLQSHTMDEAEIIRLGEDICTALDYCERVQVIHGDIKPDNIFVSEMGNYKLGDFGVAKRMDMTKSRYSSRGTYTYMAPEVYRGERYDQRADIYSLGLVLYRLTNGNREPFLEPQKQMIYYKDREEALRRRMSGEQAPLPAYASEKLAKVIQKAILYDPEERFGNAAEFRKALAQIVDVQESVKEKEKKGTVSAKYRKVQVTAIAGVIVLAGAGSFLSHISGREKEVETEAMQTEIITETEIQKETQRETEAEARTTVESETEQIIQAESELQSEIIASEADQSPETVQEKQDISFESVDISGGADFAFEETENDVKIKRYIFTKKIEEMLIEQGVDAEKAEKIIDEIDLQDFVLDHKEDIQPGTSVTMQYKEKDTIKEQYGLTITFGKVVKVYN